jgi:hypothetical protein
MKRSQYQHEPAQPGMVSMSRRAREPSAARVATHSVARASGGEPSAEGRKSSISGSSTGSSSSGTRSWRPSARCRTGKGSPQ